LSKKKAIKSKLNILENWALLLGLLESLPQVRFKEAIP
jgi:hypothetical protein